MKRILYITLTLLLAAACSQKGTIYDIPAGHPCVSFPSDAAIFEMLASDGNKITVELWRGNTQGAASIAVDIADETNGVFTPAKKSFDFADGEAVATLDFSYPDINAFGGEIYKIKITVADAEQVSPSGIKEITVSAQRKLTRKYLGTGKFYSDFWEDEWEQDLYTTEEAPDLYILPDCWKKGTDWMFTVSSGKIVWPSDFFSGYVHSSYGNVYIKSGDSYVKDGVLYLTVPRYYVYTSSTSTGSFGNGEERFTLPEGVTLP